MSQKFILHNPQCRVKAIDAINNAATGSIVTVSDPKRSILQNNLLHAVLTDISRQVVWCGKKFDVDTWKRLCVAAWLRENKQSPDLIPAIDGKGFDVIYQQTSKLSLAQCSDLIEWCYAFGAEQGVDFGETFIEIDEEN